MSPQMCLQNSAGFSFMTDQLKAWKIRISKSKTPLAQNMWTQLSLARRWKRINQSLFSHFSNGVIPIIFLLHYRELLDKAVKRLSNCNSNKSKSSSAASKTMMQHLDSVLDNVLAKAPDSPLAESRPASTSAKSTNGHPPPSSLPPAKDGPITVNKTASKSEEPQPNNLPPEPVLPTNVPKEVVTIVSKIAEVVNRIPLS